MAAWYDVAIEEILKISDGLNRVILCHSFTLSGDTTLPSILSSGISLGA